MNPFDTVRRFGQLASTLGERRKKLHRVAIAWCRNRAIADDLVQDTLVKALKNLGQLRETQAIDSWLFQIMSNCWRDNFRRERNLEEIGKFAEDSSLACEDNYHGNEIVARVRAAVLRLPVGQREVMSLIDLQGFSYDEAAQILDIPVGTVNSRLCRARETLRELLLDLTHQGDASQIHAFRRIY
jgi:RNA polymerase sigma-70 factor, ECF subfamily